MASWTKWNNCALHLSRWMAHFRRLTESSSHWVSTSNQTNCWLHSEPAISLTVIHVHNTAAVMGKSQSQFDLNRDWIASRDSIWPLKIQFSSLRFEIWFDLGLLEIRFSVWRFGTKSPIELGPLPSCEYLSQPTTSDPPETFWSSTLSDDFLTLHRLATKYLSIPETSTSIERLFSVAGAIIRARRNRLSTSVEALTCSSEHDQGASQTTYVFSD